jgi:HSP20 family protein
MRVWDFTVTENDQEILVRAEMPGFEPNELDVHLDDNILTIQAEKQQRGENQEAYRSFFRTITLPSSVDAEKVRADYRNGVLELHIPRPTGKQAKRIQVQGHRETSTEAGNQKSPNIAESQSKNKK